MKFALKVPLSPTKKFFAEHSWLSFFLALAAFVTFIFFVIYYSTTRDTTITYQETGDITYRAYLLPNDYFDQTYLTGDHKLIRELIDYLATNFSYHLSIPLSRLEYIYSYTLDAVLTVTDPADQKLLYSEEKSLYTSDLIHANETIMIDKAFNLDFAGYTATSSSFITDYELTGAKSTLQLVLTVTPHFTDSRIPASLNTPRHLSLDIPLDEKTLIPTVHQDDSFSQNTFTTAAQPDVSMLYIALGSLGVTLLLSTLAIFIYKRDLTALDIYHARLGKILRTYDTYLQQITPQYRLSFSQIVTVPSFDHLLEIHETLSAPILMLPNGRDHLTCFLISGPDKQIYVYALRLEDILAARSHREPMPFVLQREFDTSPTTPTKKSKPHKPNKPDKKSKGKNKQKKFLD